MVEMTHARVPKNPASSKQEAGGHLFTKAWAEVVFAGIDLLMPNTLLIHRRSRQFGMQEMAVKSSARGNPLFGAHNHLLEDVSKEFQAELAWLVWGT